MKNITSNIENLTSLWESVSKPFDSFFKAEEFDYSLIKNSDWPNRLWFNTDINTGMVQKARKVLQSSSSKLIIPYWDIYDSISFRILENNGFQLKFEQMGMVLNRSRCYDTLEGVSLKKVASKKEAELWSRLFRKSFGYDINPILINVSQNNTHYYIAYNENEAVGTGIIHFTNKVSGIHSVGIIPNHRRKGYAEQIMKALINESIEKESLRITLQSSEMGKGLYLKLGFKEQFKIKNYELTTD